MISEFRGKHRWLSNFWPAQVTLDGVEYPSTEHAYQAAKTVDLQAREQIRSSASPGDAKRASRKLLLRPDWEEIKVQTMLDLLRQKFKHDTELGRKLLETGHVELVEGNTWGDRFWGVCKGEGLNTLGKLLMQVREEIRHGGKT